MLAAGGGAIVNVAQVRGVVAHPGSAPTWPLSAWAPGRSQQHRRRATISRPKRRPTTTTSYDHLTTFPMPRVLVAFAGASHWSTYNEITSEVVFRVALAGHKLS